MLALKEPLYLASLTSQFDNDLSIQDIIRPMPSLLDGLLDEKKPITPLYTLFHDFLPNKPRSSVFHIDTRPKHCLHACKICSSSTSVT